MGAPFGNKNASKRRKIGVGLGVVAAGLLYAKSKPVTPVINAVKSGTFVSKAKEAVGKQYKEMIAADKAWRAEKTEKAAKEALKAAEKAVKKFKNKGSNTPLNAVNTATKPNKKRRGPTAAQLAAAAKEAANRK